MADETLTSLITNFGANFTELDAAGPQISAVFGDISAAAEESSASISDSFTMAGDAANSFAEMSQMAAENAAAAMGDVAPATDEIDSAFGDMAVNVTNNITEINAQITEMASNAEEASSTINESAESTSGGFGSMLSSVGMAVFGFQALTGMAGQLASGLLGPATSAETVDSSLTTMLGSTQAANAELSKLDAFASKTPFKTLDIDQAAEQLIGFGQSASNVIPELTAIGDALGSVGRDTPAEMQSVVDIFGKIGTEGKLTAATMNELSIHGINGWQALADATGKSIPQLKQMVSAGLIPAQQAIDDLTKGIEMNPLYAGGMARAAGTFTGLLSTLQSNWDQVLAAFGSPIIKALEPLLNNLGNTLSSPAFQSFAGSIGQGIVSVFQGIGSAASNVMGFFSQFDLSAIAFSFKYLADTVSKVIGPFNTLGSNKAVSSFFSTLKNSLTQDIFDAIGTVSSLFMNLGDTLNGLAANGSIKSFIGTLQSGFQQVANIVGGTLGANFQTFGNTIKQVGQWFQTTMLPAIQSAMPGFEHLGSVMLTTVAPAIAKVWAVGQQLARDVMPYLISAFEQVAPVVVKVGGFIANVLGNAIQFLTPYIVQATQAIGSFAEGIAERVSPIIQDLWTDLQTGIKWLTPIWDAVWPAISQTLKNTWNTITTIVKVAWDLVSGIINVGLDLFDGKWGKAWDDVKSTFGNIWNDIKGLASDAWNQIWGVVKGGINNVIDIINGFINNLDSIHVNLPGGGTIGFSIPDIPHLATGGFVPPGSVALAGDPGPYSELVFGGTSGAQVLSHAQSMAAMANTGGSGNGQTIVYVILDGKQVGSAIADSTGTAMVNMLRGAGHPIGSIAA